MAKNKTIHNNVRHGGKVYGPGMEDALEAALPKADLQRLMEAGSISGDFKGVKAVTEAAPEPEPEAEAEASEETADEEKAESEPAKGKNK